MNENKVYLSNNLLLLRTEKRWTQKYVAEQVNVTRQTIHSLESNKYNPSLILAFEISHLFGKRIEEVFLYTKNKEGNNY